MARKNKNQSIVTTKISLFVIGHDYLKKKCVISFIVKSRLKV